MKKVLKGLLVIGFIAAPGVCLSDVDVDLDNNKAQDVEFGGTNAKNAPDARTNLGLGNVENTADLAKPMSTATKNYVDGVVLIGGGYTDEQAQDAVGAMLTGNTETGITVTYDDATGKINFVVTATGGGTAAALDWGTAIGNVPRFVDDGLGNPALPYAIPFENTVDSAGTKIGRPPISGQVAAFSSTGVRSWITPGTGIGGTGLAVVEVETDPVLANMVAGEAIVSKASGDLFLKTATGGYLLAGVYTANAAPYTLTLTKPTTGTIICNDSDLSTPINCGTGGNVCSATTPPGRAVTALTLQPDTGYEWLSWGGDITGNAANNGAVTMSTNRSGSVTIGLVAVNTWTIEDNFTTNTASNYTRMNGSAVLSVDTVNHTAYNSGTATTSGWFEHATAIGTTQVVQAVLKDRTDNAVGASSGILLRSNGTTGHGCSIDVGQSRFQCEALGGSGTSIYRSFPAGKWTDGQSYLVQISVGADNTYKFEADWNNDGDFADVDEQVGVSAANASFSGTKVGVGFRAAMAETVVRSFKAKAL